ncbi:MAG: LysE family translocator [Sphingomonadales bacterium]
MLFEHVTALAAFALVSSITPGPNNLMLMASGANFGFKRTLPHMLGVTFGFTFMILAVGVGIIQIFSIFPQVYEVMKILGVAYLLFLAWKIASAAPFQKEEQFENVKPFTFFQAALFQWVNPKAWTMAVTGVTAYALPEDPALGLVLIGLVFALINLPSVSTWAVMGTQLRRFLNVSWKLRVFNITAALLLIVSLYPVVFN